MNISDDQFESPRLYSDLSWIWPLWGDPAEEYARYSGYVWDVFMMYSRRPIRKILNIGCGGGKNMVNLKQRAAVTGLDISPAMLENARGLNPDCRLVQADMRRFDLHETFDAVLFDDAVSYLVSRRELAAAFECAFRHLAPGGVLVVGPDVTMESFQQNRTVIHTPAVPSDRPELKMVIVENLFDPDASDTTYECTMVYLIRENGRLQVETDRHILGVFPEHVWREALGSAGFDVHSGTYTDDGDTYLSYACVKPE